MTHENNPVTVSQFDGNAYKSSQAAEINLNATILRAEIARSYEEFLEIFDNFYSDDVEVSSEDSPETLRGKERVRAFLLNFLVPLHVMAEVAGLSMRPLSRALDCRSPREWQPALCHWQSILVFLPGTE